MNVTRQTTDLANDELGILFLHHACDPVTLRNLESIRRNNPKATLVTFSASEPLKGGYSLDQTPDLKQIHAQLPTRRTDVLVCSWYLQKREKCDKWWIVEWDLYCEMAATEYYWPVWHYPFVASSVRLRHREPNWNWFRALQGTPESYEPHIIGAVPFIFLMSETALESTCRMLLNNPFYSGNAELRFATAANRAGFPPCGFSPQNDRITWITWDRITGSKNIFHPVKHVVDYR